MNNLWTFCISTNIIMIMVVFISVPYLVTQNIILAVYPLHHYEELRYLRKTWVKVFFQKQPLGKYAYLVLLTNKLTNLKLHGKKD